MVLKLSKRELKLSRKELNLSRRELNLLDTVFLKVHHVPQNPTKLSLEQREMVFPRGKTSSVK